MNATLEVPSRNAAKIESKSGASAARPRTALDSIAIVGLGYVGLPLSLQFGQSGVNVVGIDIDAERVRRLNSGDTCIRHIPAAKLKEALREERFTATDDFASVADVDAVIICVPTPLNENREPDISYVLATGRAMGPHLRPGMLVVLESTTYPGTTDEDLRAVLEETSGMKAGVDFHLAYSPEREDPGNPGSRVQTIPKVIGGFTPACLDKARSLYVKALRTIVPVSSCRAAEATKLLENIFRSVNIALVNELKVVYEKMGIDIWEVIDAAKTKPFGYMPFYPGPGLGGHCIPIDPFYLTWKAREFGQNTRFIELAGEINTGMPEYVIHRVASALNRSKKAVNGSKVLVIGLAYKANVDDDRESPSYELIDALREQGANVSYHDPYVPVIRKTRKYPHLAGKKSVAWNERTVKLFDLVLIATAHANVDYHQLGAWAKCIVDTRNAMADVNGVADKVVKA